MAKAETARKSVPGMHGPCPPTDTCVRNTEDWHDTGSTLSQPPTASSRRCEQFRCSHSATKTVNSCEEYFFTPPPPSSFLTYTAKWSRHGWNETSCLTGARMLFMSVMTSFHFSFCNGGGHSAGKMTALRNENLTKFSWWKQQHQQPAIFTEIRGHFLFHVRCFKDDVCVLFFACSLLCCPLSLSLSLSLSPKMQWLLK